MTVTVKHSKTNTISDWTQAQLDEQIALGNFPAGTTLANIVLPSDWNNDHTLTGVGTMAEQNANSVAITGGTINNTSIGATTASTGKFTTVTTPSVTATTTDLTLSAISTGGVFFNTVNGTGFRVRDTGSATSNYWQALSNGSAAIFRSSDSIANAQLQTGGTGAVQLGTASGVTQLQVSHTASAVNYVQVTGSANTKASIISTAGSDSNISMAFQPKGTGAIDLAAGSSGVNISNGGTVTAITRTNTGSNYTSFPSLAITAPTTAGGVQATASTATMYATGANIVSGGTGYTLNDVVTLSGGTPQSVGATYTITGVSAGVVTAVTPLNYAIYTALPSNPVSVTGGTGTGLTLTVFWNWNSATITNAGSGYIEQPTVSFSGGGGSGATAYAQVGSAAKITGLSNVLSFYTPNGEAFRVQDSGSTSSAYWVAYGTSGGAILRGTSASSVAIGSASAVPIQFQTNTSAEQFRVSHTASAVNYVQVTGAATGSFPVISAQGSDATTGLNLYSKGAARINFFNNNGSNRHVSIGGNGTAAVNYLDLNGNTATNSPSIAVAGTDTNIDLALTPKGTGLVAFGTYTAGAPTATGYISIKSAAGVTYKVLVST